MKYYLIAGEASGDLHGSNLMRELKQLDDSAEFRFWGGELMASQGGSQVKHYCDTAFMGFFEVITNLRAIRRNFQLCQNDIVRWNPDVVVLIDYPGFNLRMAEFVHKKGFRVFYYISPKLWAWNQRRVNKVKSYVDRMYTILPFETEFYKKHGVNVYYSGNPVLDAISNRPNKNESWEVFRQRNQLPDKPLVGLLAGSRKQELHWVLPDMLKMVDKFPDFQFVIAGAPSFTIDDYRPYIEGYNVNVLFDQTYEIVQQSRVALVTSGTATLETALLNCPQVVCYRMWGGRFTHFMARTVIIRVPYISLVNLILDREGVKELFQVGFTEKTLEKELNMLLNNDYYRRRMFVDYEELMDKMGGAGSSRRTAELMVAHLNE